MSQTGENEKDRPPRYIESFEENVPHKERQGDEEETPADPWEMPVLADTGPSWTGGYRALLKGAESADVIDSHQHVPRTGACRLFTHVTRNHASQKYPCLRHVECVDFVFFPSIRSNTLDIFRNLSLLVVHVLSSLALDWLRR